MTRFSVRSLMILAVAAPLLAACGEGWVMQPVRNYTPYAEDRTAGPGVAYVRAHLLPEKGPVLTPIGEPAGAVLEDAAPIFDLKQAKEPK